MYYCIINTVTEEANSKVISELEKGVINRTNSDALLFKFPSSVITIDTRATITYIPMDLTNLVTYIATIKFDINKFNLCVKEKRKQFRNRRETSHYILVILLKAYEMVQDQVFNNWLIQKKKNYEEVANVAPDSLMLDAPNHFQSLKTKGK